jgi:catecholate siderophore receptor
MSEHLTDLAPSSGTPAVCRAALLPLGALMMAGLTQPAWSQDTAPPKAKELPTVTVQADADRPDGARATTTRVGKVLQDPHDVPQAVTTVTQSIMEQQQVGSLKEALRNVSGLSFNAAEGGRSGDNMNLRGFYTFGDMYLDGIRDTAQYNRETFNLEQIDVLRGAGAMLFGRGQAGGVINQVSKTPLSKDQYKLTGSVGTHDYREVTADLNKVVNEHTALRINAMQRDEGSWRSNPASGAEPEVHRQGLAVSLGLNLNTSNQFWLNHYWLRTADTPDYGVPFDAATRQRTTAFSPSTFWGTDATFDNSLTSITTLVNEYRITPDSQLRSQLRVADYGRSYWARTPSGTQAPNSQALVLGNGGTANGGPTRVSDYETVTLQSDFSTKFQLGGMKHAFLTGLEYLNENSYRHTLKNVGGTSASNPPVYLPYVAATTGTPNVFHSDSYALYAQDTVEFIPNWKATLGLRRDEMDAQYSSTTSPRLKYGENSYRSAISYHPSDDTHYYIGWSDSFSPTADLYQLTVTPLPPERSDVIEVGAKWMLLDGDLALRAAVYQATKAWERSADLESTAAILTKKRRTKGLELEVAGRINEDWEVFAGWALMDAKILEVAENVNATTGAITYANPEYAGKRARNTPKYTFNAWTTYQLNAWWKLGGGVEIKGDRQAVNPSGAGAVPTLDGVYHPNTAGAYARWDAMAEYEYSRNWLFRMNVKNLFDKVYDDAVYDNGAFTVPGPRRTVTLTAEYKF